MNLVVWYLSALSDFLESCCCGIQRRDCKRPSSYTQTSISNTNLLSTQPSSDFSRAGAQVLLCCAQPLQRWFVWTCSYPLTLEGRYFTCMGRVNRWRVSFNTSSLFSQHFPQQFPDIALQTSAFLYINPGRWNDFMDIARFYRFPKKGTNFPE